MVLASDLRPAIVTKRPMSLGWSIALVIAVCAVGLRAVESSGDPIGFTRVVVSSLSIGIFFAVRRYSLIKGLMFALAFELAAGTALFVLVDLPLVNKIGPELGRATAILLERGAPNVVHVIGMLARP